jgi:diadenosine tetraphosphate (Ap4A) HIT family hydrolase
MTECACCVLVAELEKVGKLHDAGEHWTINERVNHQRPALVIQTRRHVESLGQLNPNEVNELGEILKASVERVEKLPTVEQCYVLYFNEGDPGHVHLHLVPRFVGETEKANQLPDRSRAGVTDEFDLLVREISKELCPDYSEPSRLVRSILWLCQAWAGVDAPRKRRVSLYPWVAQAFRRVSYFDAAEKYVLLWLFLWLSCWLTESTKIGSLNDWSLLLMAVGAYRFVDMFLFEVRILLAPTPLRSIARGLVLRGFNLVEIAIGSSVLITAISSRPTTSSLLMGFRIATLQGINSMPGIGIDVIGTMATSVCLVILIGGVAMLLSKTAERVKEVRR